MRLPQLFRLLRYSSDPFSPDNHSLFDASLELNVYLQIDIHCENI